MLRTNKKVTALLPIKGMWKLANRLKKPKINKHDKCV